MWSIWTREWRLSSLILMVMVLMLMRAVLFLVCGKNGSLYVLYIVALFRGYKPH